MRSFAAALIAICILPLPLSAGSYEDDITAILAPGIDAFRAEPECTGKPLRVTRLAAEMAMNMFAADEDVDSEGALYIGGQYLDVAEIAADAGCDDVAREMFRTVLKVYVGAVYSGLQNRAMAGLAGL